MSSFPASVEVEWQAERCNSKKTVNSLKHVSLGGLFTEYLEGTDVRIFLEIAYRKTRHLMRCDATQLLEIGLSFEDLCNAVLHQSPHTFPEC